MLVKGISSLMLYPGLGSGREWVTPQRAQNTMKNTMKFMMKRIFSKFLVVFGRYALMEGLIVLEKIFHPFIRSI